MAGWGSDNSPPVCHRQGERRERGLCHVRLTRLSTGESGHPWNRVVERICSFRSPSTRIRLPRTSYNSSRAWKTRLTTGSSISSHRCSAGCRPGEYPFTPDPDTTRAKLRRCLDVGVKTFLDLTEAHELDPYEAVLREEARAGGLACEYVRLPIPGSNTIDPDRSGCKL